MKGNILFLLLASVSSAVGQAHVRGGADGAAQAHREETAVGRVLKLRLMNADTDQPIPGYDPLNPSTTIDISTLPTANLNVEAITEGSVGSIQWSFNSALRNEDTPVWSVCGNSGPDFYACSQLKVGSNATIKATPFSGKGASGTEGSSVSIELALVKANVNPPVNITFTLMNADTDMEIGPLLNDTVIDLAQTPRVNVRANVEQSHLIRSVQFALDGRVVRVENGAPYALFGNAGNDYHPWTPPVGRCTIAGFAYGSPGAQGTLRSSKTVSIVVQATALAPTPAPQKAPTRHSIPAPVPIAPPLRPPTPAPLPVAPPVTAPALAPTNPTRRPTSAPVPVAPPVRPAPVHAPPVSPAPKMPVPIFLGNDHFAPKLVNMILFDPVVDVSNGPASAVVQITAQDDSTGLSIGRLTAGGGTVLNYEAQAQYIPTGNTGSSNITFNLTLSFPSLIRQGKHYMTVYLTDMAMNRADLGYQHFNARGFPSFIQVINTNQDLTAPTVVSFVASTTMVDVTRSSATMAYSVELEDAGFGIAHCEIAAYGPTRRLDTYQNTGTVSRGVKRQMFYLNMTVPAFIPPGNFPLELHMVDNGGNTVTLYSPTLAQRGFPSTIQVVNTMPDVTPPAILTFRATTPLIVNTTSSMRSASFTLTVLDDKSGIWTASVIATYNNNKTMSDEPRYQVFIPGPIKQVFEFHVKFGQFTWKGVYKLSVRLGDRDGNAGTVSSEELVARGFPGSFTVV